MRCVAGKSHVKKEDMAYPARLTGKVGEFSTANITMVVQFQYIV